VIEVLDTDITKLEVDAIASTLRKADELGATSLALVAFGTGVGGFPLDEAARIEIDEVSRYLEAGGSAIERVCSRCTATRPARRSRPRWRTEDFGAGVDKYAT
jgi:O-acetyl-ADP-ribose deacetylase (regulator of RNase III)